MRLPLPDDISKFSVIDSDNLDLSHNTAKHIKKKHESVKGDFVGSKLVRILDHSREIMIDRRAHKRFAAKRGAFALIGSNLRIPIRINTMSLSEIALSVFKSKFCKMGRIKDICLEGIAFCYIYSNCQPEETSELDIMLAEDRFYLDNIRFKIISDFEIAGELPDGPIKMRQLSLQFKDLTPNQLSRLDFFIKNHTIGTE